MQQALKALLFAVLAAFPLLFSAKALAATYACDGIYVYGTGAALAACESAKQEGRDCTEQDRGQWCGQGGDTKRLSVVWCVQWTNECHVFGQITECGSNEDNFQNECKTKCVAPEVRDAVTGSCGIPPPPTCSTGEHAVGQECQPDNCPDGQAWNPEQSICTPIEPEPDIGPLGPGAMIPVPAGTCNGSDCVITPNPSGLIPGLNCGGYTCVSSPSMFVPASAGGGCFTTEADAVTLYCNYEPVYQGGGAFVPAHDPATGLPPTTPSTTPAPLNDPTAPPLVICPPGSTLTAGLCVTGATGGQPTSPDGTSAAPTPGTAVCPVGFFQTASGQCLATTQSLICPVGYTSDSNGGCVSTSTIGPNGAPYPATGSGTGTGSTCGGAGQPPCSVVLADPGNNHAINSAVPSDASESALSNSFDALRNQLSSWGENDPSAGSQSTYSGLFDGWFDVIPSGGCSPMTATIFGHTLTINHCQHAPLIADILGYALWLYFAASTFVMLTGGKPQ